LQNACIVASIGATAFIIFALPKGITAKPRCVIGVPSVGLICGTLFGLIPHSDPALSILISSLAFGMTMFLIVVLDLEHPPACGTALGIAIVGISWSIAAAVITSVLVLSVVHNYFKDRIRDLV
ncbi:HPP family protein, partial [bacterium I07]